MQLREVGNPSDEELIKSTITHAKPFSTSLDLAPLASRIARARVVMLGESSHGTQEFYEWRRVISQELILHHGFRCIAVEGDWPPCSKLNEYIHGHGESVTEVLHAFERWPTWMWANTEIAELADWLRSFNQSAPRERRAGFHGLDVYSLFESIDAALEKLREISPLLARRLAVRFACFDAFSRDEKAYARSLIHFPTGCKEAVAKNLRDLLEQRLARKASTNLPIEDPFFDVEQNTKIVANAENYYRAMVHSDDDSWNVRDRHMMETLKSLLAVYGAESKVIVWAHNTHIGDYRATTMHLRGQINLGGLAREELGEKQVALVGFGTYAGEVIASSAWDGPTEIMHVPSGKPGSYEHAFHQAAAAMGAPNFYVDLHGREVQRGALSQTRGHRAIGVVYEPQHEALGNYVPTSLASRYDAFVFLDRTSALHPLEQKFNPREIPETWPLGL